MRNITALGNATPTENSSYSPSVPLSVYREISAELHATKTQLESVNAQNQHLARENQQLRLEIDKVVQSAYRLQQVVNSFETYNPQFAPQPAAVNSVLGLEMPQSNRSTSFNNSTAELASDNPFSVMNDPANSVLSKPLFTEHQEVRPPAPSKTPRASEMGGLWLAVTIFVIVVAAFGAGYWIVRPMLINR